MMTKTLAILVSVCLSAAAFAQSAITLRPTATVGEASAVTLGDIADLVGDDATRLGSTVIVAASQSKPLAKGTMKVTGRVGQVWASAWAPENSAAQAVKPASRNLRIMSSGSSSGRPYEWAAPGDETSVGLERFKR